MPVYSNRCGKFTLELTDPWPMWIRLYNEAGEDLFRGVHATSADLYDLRHLIDRAIVAAEAKERR